MIELSNQIIVNRDISLSNSSLLLLLSLDTTDDEITNEKPKTINVSNEDKKRIKGVIIVLGKLKDETNGFHLILEDIVKQTNQQVSIKNNDKSELIKYIERIRFALSTNIDLIKSLLMIAEDITLVPTMPLCKIDNIVPDWTMNITMNNQASAVLDDNSSKNLLSSFVDYLTKYNMPVCNNIYNFISSPKETSNSIVISQYKFLPNEFKIIINYFITHQEILTSAIMDGLYNLIIYDTNLNDDDLTFLAANINIFTSLKILSLKHNNLTSNGIMALTKSIRSDKLFKLNVLQLDDNKIDIEGARSLARSLQYLLFLSTLSISNNPIGDLGLYYICKHSINRFRYARRSMPMPITLSSDNMSNYDGNISKFKKIGTDGYISDLDTSTVYDSDDNIELNNDDFDMPNDGTYSDNEGEDEYIALATKSDYSHNVIRNSILSKQVANADEVQEEKVENQTKRNSVRRPSALSIRLSKNEILDPINENKIDGDELIISKKPTLYRLMTNVRYKMAAVCAFLRLKNRRYLSISSIFLSNCGLSSMGAKMLGHCLLDNKQITSVDISNNNISDDGCLYIAKVLESSTSLKVLNASNNAITDVGIELICRAVCKNNNLTIQTIDFSKNIIGPSGINWLTAITSKERLGGSAIFIYDKFEISNEFKHPVPFTKKYTVIGNSGVDDNYTEIEQDNFDEYSSNELNDAPEDEED